MFIYKHIPRLHTYYIELQTIAAFFFYIFIHKCDKSSLSKGISRSAIHKDFFYVQNSFVNSFMILYKVVEKAHRAKR